MILVTLCMYYVSAQFRFELGGLLILFYIYIIININSFWDYSYVELYMFFES